MVFTMLGFLAFLEFETNISLSTYRLSRREKKVETISFAINDNLAQLIDHKLQLGMMMIQYMSH